MSKLHTPDNTIELVSRPSPFAPRGGSALSIKNSAIDHPWQQTHVDSSSGATAPDYIHTDQTAPHLVFNLVFLVVVKGLQNSTGILVFSNTLINCLFNNSHKIRQYTNLDVYAGWWWLHKHIHWSYYIFNILQLKPGTVRCRLSQVDVAFCYDNCLLLLFKMVVLTSIFTRFLL